MDKLVLLKDGTEVRIREMRADDLERSVAFFKALPPEDRTYLRYDVTNRREVEERIRAMAGGRILRLVAVANGEIIADGSLESEGYAWKDHVAELRLIVARRYQRRSLGMRLARELYLLAASRRVEEITARVMAPQHGARRILHRLGFREEAVLPDYVKDIDGRCHDLILMRCKLRVLMREMENYFALGDWQRMR